MHPLQLQDGAKPTLPIQPYEGAQTILPIMLLEGAKSTPPLHLRERVRQRMGQAHNSSLAPQGVQKSSQYSVFRYYIQNALGVLSILWHTKCHGGMYVTHGQSNDCLLYTSDAADD